MKKILLTVSIALSMGLGAEAQVINGYDGAGRPDVVPADLTVNKKPVVYTTMPNVITIFDDNFNVTKKIELNGNYTNRTITEEAIVQPTGVKVKKEPTVIETPEWAKGIDVSTITSADQFAQAVQSAIYPDYPAGYGFIDSTGFVDYNGNFCCVSSPYQKFFNQDNRYPLGSYYCLVDGNIVEYYHEKYDYEYEYSTDDATWTEVSNYSSDNSISFRYFDYKNFDSNLNDDSDGYYISQTLFNSDDAWEYIVPFGSMQTTVDYSVYQATDEGLKIHRITQERYEIEGYRVMSDNGKIVIEANMDLSYGEYWRINGEVYYADGWQLYRLDELSTAIQPIEAPERGDSFVKVGDGSIVLQLSDDDTDSQVVFTDMGGQTVGQLRIAKGATSTSINSELIGNGVYNVSIQRGGQVLRSQNVLIK